MFVLLLGHIANPQANMERMLKLALVHDIVEIETGDTYAFSDKAREGKKEREERGIHKLLDQLPTDVQTELKQLFFEYENSSTLESRIVKSFDKMQPLLVNIINDGISWQKDEHLTLQKIDKTKRPHMEHDPVILAIYNALIQEVKDKKLINNA